MRRRLSVVLLSLSLGVLALPTGPALAQTPPTPQQACLTGQVFVLVNPTITRLPSGEVAATGGTFTCVTLGPGVIGGSPLPVCAGTTTLAIVDAIVVDGVVVQGTLLCVIVNTPRPPLPGGGLLDRLFGILGRLF